MKKVTFKNKAVTLIGRSLDLNSEAPNFKVVSKDLKEISLDNFKNKIKLINFFPSLDTKVCDLQVKEFNKKAASLSDEIAIISISKDLPFAQKRFCDAFNINKINVLSDYKNSSFAINYGVLIKELNLLARGAIILDKNNIIRYIQIVPEITNSVDYDDVLKNLNEVIKKPQVDKEKKSAKCMPCEGKMPSLTKEKILKNLEKLAHWQLVEDKKIVKEFSFKNFEESNWFSNIVATISEEQNHHPSIVINYNRVKIILTTHAMKGLSENDFIMADIISKISI